MSQRSEFPPSRASANDAADASHGSNPGHWLVSTRSVGEVLTTEIRGDQLQMMMFSGPDTPLGAELEQHLTALAEVTAHDPRPHASEGPIPEVAARATRALLRLVQELEDRSGADAGAVLFLATGETACFGCVGGAMPDVWFAGQLFAAPWVVIEPKSEAVAATTRALAFAVPVTAELDLRLQWPFLVGATRPQGVVVDAAWTAVEGLEVTVRALGGPSSAQRVAGDGETPSLVGATGTPSSDPGGFFAGWFADLEHPSPGESDPATGDPLVATTRAGGDRAAAAPPPTTMVPNELTRIADELRAAAEAPELMPESTDEELMLVGATPDGGAPDDASALASEPHAIAAPPRRPDWPASMAPARSSWVERAGWIGLVFALFAMGLFVGSRGDGQHVAGVEPAAYGLLRAVGLRGAHYTVSINTNPEGATISADDRLTPLRTPADLLLTPGLHRVTLSLPDGGQWSKIVKGDRDERVPLDVSLLGSLQVLAPESLDPIAVTIDGEPRGFAPVRVAGIAPGPHELEYSASGQPPWTQTVRVGIGGDVVVTARALELPATGIIEVRARLTDDQGTHDVKGAAVWVDGEHRGGTPLELELPRGPHSLRAELHGETPAIQLIDLPGGNQRYATFAFGDGVEPPRLVVRSPLGPVPRDTETPVVVTIDGLAPRDVREMWLHASDPDGTWKRYPMITEATHDGLSASVPFPVAALDSAGVAQYYVSALTTTGEEYFTEIVGTRRAPGIAMRVRRRHHVAIEPGSPTAPPRTATAAESKPAATTSAGTPSSASVAPSTPGTPVPGAGSTGPTAAPLPAAVATPQGAPATTPTASPVAPAPATPPANAVAPPGDHAPPKSP